VKDDAKSDNASDEDKTDTTDLTDDLDRMPAELWRDDPAVVAAIEEVDSALDTAQDQAKTTGVITDIPTRPESRPGVCAPTPTDPNPADTDPSTTVRPGGGTIILTNVADAPAKFTTYQQALVSEGFTASGIQSINGVIQQFTATKGAVRLTIGLSPSDPDTGESSLVIQAETNCFTVVI
jgi:hypothetical protein